MKKAIAVILMLTMLLSLAVAEGIQADPDVLEYVGMDFDGVFNAFFAENADDRMITELTGAMLLGTTPYGDIILNGVEGMSLSDEEDSIYYGIGSVEIVVNEDGSADYNVSMREDVCFSDGHPADIDDVIFTLYVLADPSYDGPVNICHLPVAGLEAYSGTSAVLAELMIAAGRDNTEFVYWDEATQKAFWSELGTAGTAVAQEIVDYILENYLTEEYTAEIGKTVAEVKADPLLQVQLAMVMWGYDHAYTEGMTAADYWQAILAEYGGDVLLAVETESIGADIFALMEGYEEKYGGIVQLGEPVERIEGLVRTGDYSLTIHAAEEDDNILYALASLPVMPLHYYGSEEAYDYEASAFGFEKGNLASIHEKDAVPLGCGEYVFVSYGNGTATLKGNPAYFEGEAEYSMIQLQEG